MKKIERKVVKILLDLAKFLLLPSNFMVIVAQLVRVSVCGSEGRGFESRLSPLKA